MTADSALAYESSKNERIKSVDILRGLVMVLMAIDHVRVYSGIPVGSSDAGVFFTRWITHFCAPAFVFFAGTSAFLYGIKLADKTKLAKYLVVRGLLLVLFELTVIRFFWAFNVNYFEFVLAGVIWMLGWCMVLLAAMIWLRPSIIGLGGIAIILFQQLFGYLPNVFPEGARTTFGGVWEFFYPGGYKPLGGVAILYVLIPWIGVMAAGYGFGAILKMENGKRDKLCPYIGLTLTLLFIVIGSSEIIMSPSTPDSPPFLFRLLNQSKYPASQLFLMMTLGPTILLIPFAEKMKGWLAESLSTIGRVPFFYYLLHILVIHISALIVQLIQLGGFHQDWFMYAPFTSVPEQSRWSLGLLYFVFLIDVAALFFICRWYALYKFNHPEKKWLTYI